MYLDIRNFSCPYCEKVADSWEELAEFYANKRSVKIAEMDCIDYKKTCKKFGVNEYPYIQLFKNGVKYQRFGNKFKRTTKNMIAFIEKFLEIDEYAKDET